MKKSSALLVIASVLSFSFSFAGTPVNATVNGKSFVPNAAGVYTAQMTNGKVAAISFKGNTEAQKLNVEYKVNEVGDILVKGISFEQDGKKFESAPESTVMNVTKFEWSSDKKSFILSASFDCTAQSKGPFDANDDAIAIKGNIENVTVQASTDVAIVTE